MTREKGEGMTMSRSEYVGTPALLIACVALLLIGSTVPANCDDGIDFTKATVVARGEQAPLPEQSAATVLLEEVQKRATVKWESATNWPQSGCSIALVSGKDTKLDGKSIPASALTDKPEGYGVVTDNSDSQRPVVWIVGAGPRGVLFGVGRFLRTIECRQGSVRLPGPLNVTTSPQYPIRGHQLGYRATANSYDAWTPEQFDQYIRELTFFGTNSIEGIPFHDERPTVNTYPRAKMNVDISRICQKYGLDYWIWTPADFDLKDAQKRAKALADHEQLFRDCPRMDHIFFPGGDPGDNPPELVLPYLEDMSKILLKYHPKGKIWLSLQGFRGAKADVVYDWIDKNKPAWFGGLVAGPGSPPIPMVRARLNKQYPLRDYPDITHIVRCQYPAPWLDPAIAFTLGREGVNPRPRMYARIFRELAPFTIGFSSYSDGIHDDVNKVVWSELGWDSSADLRDILIEYTRVFFGPDVAEEAAEGILTFERTYEGPLATNGGVEANLALWQKLDEKAPGLSSNWRWQLCLLRAYYDAYTRERQIYERNLEEEANLCMRKVKAIGADKAMDEALAVLKRAQTNRVHPELRDRVVALCDMLFKSIGLQTSVPKYGASGEERGAVLDFLDYPLNNQWWIEDEFAKVRKMAAETEKYARLETMATWEHPGSGSFYDCVGDVGRSPHVVRGDDLSGGPLLPVLAKRRVSIPGFMWWDEGARRTRLTWISDLWPTSMYYSALDPNAEYVLRTAGNGECYPRVSDTRLEATAYGKELGDVKEFPIPKKLYADGTLTLTFDAVSEPGVNWRYQSRLCEVWLIKK